MTTLQCPIANFCLPIANRLARLNHMSETNEVGSGLTQCEYGDSGSSKCTISKPTRQSLTIQPPAERSLSTVVPGTECMWRAERLRGRKNIFLGLKILFFEMVRLWYQYQSVIPPHERTRTGPSPAQTHAFARIFSGVAAKKWSNSVQNSAQLRWKRANMLQFFIITEYNPP